MADDDGDCLPPTQHSQEGALTSFPSSHPEDVSAHSFCLLASWAQAAADADSLKMPDDQPD